MSNLRTLRRRIRSIGNIHDITKAMEMISAVRFKRLENRFKKSLPYIENLEGLISRLISEELVAENPLFEKRMKESELLVVISGDRGLCGSFNTNLLKRVDNYIQQNTGRKITILSIGKVGTGYLKRRGRDFFDVLPNLGHKFTRDSATEVTQKLIDVFLSGKADAISVFSMRMERPGVHLPVHDPFLDLSYLIKKKEAAETPRDYIFEPDRKTTLWTLVDLFVRQKFYNTLLRAVTAEYNARMIAMKMATDNSKELINELTLLRNKIRQAMITKEISEIIGGVNAMS